LQTRAEALDASIEELTSRLESLPTGGNASLRRARRTAIVNEIESLERQQSQIEAAAQSYPGQVTTLAAAELPERSTLVELVKGAVIGGALGFVVGVLWAVLRGRHRMRRRAQQRTDQRLSPPAPEQRRTITST
jgi:hypothetical protein